MVVLWLPTNDFSDVLGVDFLRCALAGVALPNLTPGHLGRAESATLPKKPGCAMLVVGSPVNKMTSYKH